MFRAEEKATRTNNNERDAEHDENSYGFSGATLRISGPDTISPEPDTQSGLARTTSSVLSGSDGGANTFQSTPVVNSVSATVQGVAAEQPQPIVFVKPKVGSPKNFFSFREGLFEQAVGDCVNILLRPANDTDIVGTWLLTEINHWDHERERLFILTTKTLVEIKYDFISLRILQNTKIRLNQVDTIIKGNIAYPDGSLVPKIGGISNGVATIISGGFNACKDYQRLSTEGLALANRFDFTSFKPIDRSDSGIRIMWNKGQPLGWLASWNPFAEDIPWKTVTDHPLYSYKDPYKSPHLQEELEKYRKYYSVDGLHEALVQTISNNNMTNASGSATPCKFEERPIIMQNYVGIGAMIHNKHNFGFFKVRGKFSF